MATSVGESVIMSAAVPKAIFPLLHQRSAFQQKSATLSDYACMPNIFCRPGDCTDMSLLAWQ